MPIVSIETLEHAITVSRENNRPIEIDWTNRQIVILGKPRLKRSPDMDGKPRFCRYWKYLFNEDFRNSEKN